MIYPSKDAMELFKAWWKYYYLKGLYGDEMSEEQLREISGYEPHESAFVEGARNRAYSAVTKYHEK